MNNESNSKIIIFKTDDERITVDVRFEEDDVWLSQAQMSALFERDKRTISEHITNIFTESELDKKVVVRNFRITTKHGAIAGKTQETDINLYNLDVIISVGYRVKSLRGTQFRQWATKRLNEYIKKGFTLDDERLKKLNTVSQSETRLSIPGDFVVFSTDMKFGDRGEAVKDLQEFLAYEGSFVEALITGQFGRLTRNAVMKFQKKYNITPVSGYVGYKTRHKMQQLTGF